MYSAATNEVCSKETWDTVKELALCSLKSEAISDEQNFTYENEVLQENLFSNISILDACPTELIDSNIWSYEDPFLDTNTQNLNEIAAYPFIAGLKSEPNVNYEFEKNGTLCNFESPLYKLAEDSDNSLSQFCLLDYPSEQFITKEKVEKLDTLTFNHSLQHDENASLFNPILQHEDNASLLNPILQHEDNASLFNPILQHEDNVLCNPILQHDEKNIPTSNQIFQIENKKTVFHYNLQHEDKSILQHGDKGILQHDDEGILRNEDKGILQHDDEGILRNEDKNVPMFNLDSMLLNSNESRNGLVKENDLLTNSANTSCILPLTKMDFMWQKRAPSKVKFENVDKAKDHSTSQFEDIFKEILQENSCNYLENYSNKQLKFNLPKTCNDYSQLINKEKSCSPLTKKLCNDTSNVNLKKLGRKSTYEKIQPLISKNRIKYTLIADPLKGRKSIETICFATHSATKNFNKRTLNLKKSKPKCVKFHNKNSSLNKLCRHQKQQSNSCKDIWGSISKFAVPCKSKSLNCTPEAINCKQSNSKMVLPIGETGCSIAIPSSISVDIHSFSPEAVTELSEGLKKSLSSDEESALNSAHVVNHNKQDQLAVNVENISTEPHSPVKNLSSKVIDDCSNKMNNSSYKFKKIRVKSPLIDTKNVAKIQIFTKSPKKMVVTTKLNGQSKKLNNILNRNPNLFKERRSFFIPATLNRFINMLIKHVQFLPDDLMKKLNFPIEAVKRSYLTAFELNCIEQQAHLLTAIAVLEKSHNECILLRCVKCEAIKEKKQKLTDMQMWKKYRKRYIGTYKKPETAENSGPRMINVGHSKSLDFSMHTETVSNSKEPDINADYLTHKISASQSSANRDENICDGDLLQGKNIDDVKQDITKLHNKLSVYGDRRPPSYMLDDVCVDNVLNSDRDTDRLTLSVDSNDSHFDHRYDNIIYKATLKERTTQQEKEKNLDLISHLVESYLKNLTDKKIDHRSSCNCIDGCKSFLNCACANEGLLCTDCFCVCCENPLNAFNLFSIDASATRMDHCLMQKIYDLKLKELYDTLRTERIVPCCKNSFKTYQLVPNVVECLVCSSLLSYSWCKNEVHMETNRKRNHCIICCKCQPFLNSHCHVCGCCTLSSVLGKCLHCDDKKLNFV